MVESKLESLVQRLEAAVARQEALAAGGAGPSSGPSGPKMSKLAREYVAAVSPALDTLKARTADLDNSYVTELVSMLSQLAVKQVSVINLMAAYKKPADVQFLVSDVTAFSEAG